MEGTTLTVTSRLFSLICRSPISIVQDEFEPALDFPEILQVPQAAAQREGMYTPSIRQTSYSFSAVLLPG